jgi:hypothetical protein
MSEFKFQEYALMCVRLAAVQRISRRRSRARPEGTLAPNGQHVDGTRRSAPCAALMHDGTFVVP